MSKEVKKLVDQAKRAFADKQLELAEKICQEILNIDSKNYKAYLLLGAIHQVKNPTLASNYLRKAIKCPGDSSLAYQGLLKCVPNDEVPEICEKYLKSAPSKYEEVHKKLQVCALVVKTTSACIEILQSEVTLSNDQKRVRSAYKTLVDIYMFDTAKDKLWLPLFRESFEFVISDRTINDHCKLYIKYLKILKKLKDYDDLLKSSIEMLGMYPKEYIPLDMICWVYVQKYKQNDDTFKNYVSNPVDTYADDVLEMNEFAPYALLAKGLYLYDAENYVAARDFLNKANNNAYEKDDNTLCLRILGDTHLKLHAYTLAEYCYWTSQTVNLNYLISLVEQNVEAKCKDAIALIPKINNNAALNENDRNLLAETFIKALIRVGQTSKADELIGQYKDDANRYNLLIGFKYFSADNFTEALQLLQKIHLESSNYYLLLGQCFLKLDRFSEALDAFLRATKLESHNADCFYHLGRIYLHNGDTDRARKCFEKCMFLHPQHEQCGILLSAMYRKQSEWESNAKILQFAAQSIPNSSCKWAELYLGFHYLAQNQFDEAISSFRTVLRVDANNFVSWDGLANSYLKRGSYNSALKVYQKICELNESDVFAQLQVANIRTTLRLYKDAITSYEQLLSKKPDYVPALKGIADAHLGIAYKYLNERLVGRSKVHVENAIGYLIRSIHIRSNFICLWRRLANCFDFIAALPAEKAFTSVPGLLLNESQELVTIKGDKLYEIASRFYCRAIKLNTSDLLLWYELSLNYYKRAVKYGTNETRKKYLSLAMESAKHIIKDAPYKWKHWNLLGVICTSKDMENLPLAQHCFIKALELDRKLAVVWTNLGALYLSHGKMKLANIAFTQAQQAEPTYSTAWTGQALIAEVMQSKETIGLLRHAVSLAYHDESAIQYAYWICSLLNESKNHKQTRFYIEHLNVVSWAIDSITWYCDANKDNLSPESLSYLGFLYYLQHNWRNAIKTFRLAAERTEQSSVRDQMLSNLGYSLLKNNEPQKAAEVFEQVSEANFRSAVGLAHAHFKAKQYENSYEVYQRALECLANSDAEKSMILVALSSMVYAFQGENDAKSLLFQCIGEENQSIEALLSACALGILHNDLQLSELVLKELQKFERDNHWCHHIAFLESEFYLKKHDKVEALRYLYKKVHQFPDKPLLRKVLASFLLNNNKGVDKHHLAANRMVEATIVMQRSHSKREILSMEVAKLLVLASETMRHIDPKMSRYLAQKAVHVNPLCKEAWAAVRLAQKPSKDHHVSAVLHDESQ